MRLKLWLSVMLVLVPAGTSAQAPEWRRPDADGKYYWVLVDAKSIQRDAATGRTRFTYAHAGGPNYRTASPRSAPPACRRPSTAGPGSSTR